MHHRSFRYGLITTAVLAGGQLGLLFALPVFLQDGKGLSAEENGLWILPLGIVIILASQVGAVLTRHIGTTRTVQVGLVSETIGLVVVALAIRPSMSFLDLLPGFVLFGMGVGFATSQLTNVILSDVDLDKSGVASGANTTVRQVGAALGIAVIGSILTVQTIQHTTERVRASPGRLCTGQGAVGGCDPGGRAQLPASPGHAAREAAALSRALDQGVADGARFALFFAAGLVTIGSFLSLLIPPVGPFTAGAPAAGVVEEFEAFEPVIPDPELLVDADAPGELRRRE